MICPESTDAVCKVTSKSQLIAFSSPVLEPISTLFFKLGRSIHARYGTCLFLGPFLSSCVSLFVSLFSALCVCV